MSDANNPIETIFNAARALPKADQLAYLDLACRHDPVLRERIERLLQAGPAAEALFAAKPAGLTDVGATVEDSAVREGPGTVVGRYKLLQQIGEGGMGVVYMAEQAEPVRRRVALKIIKLGMDTRAVVARFEAERQALALMDHPNIARVLDGGATEAGRPYFVMELVQGVPITEYCDRNKLAAGGRLKLFIAVCQAIQSAHQKGIIHRDIKPSNVLVTIEHGEPMPKVIDFGIAKATNQKLTEKTLFTNYATMIGTPAYMSPEQAEMTSLDVDTRADIYSLGVLLYELLTGSTPFPAERLRSLGYGAMQRVIVEEEPERPSTRLGTLTAEQKTTVSRNRGEDLQALGALLRGDLDWIVMRCLEKDRRRRYETANALAADLQRHLGNEPVTARPPAATYRFQKWVRRNRTFAISTAAVSGALIAASVLSTAAFLRERTARLRAAEAENASQEARRVQAMESIRADTVSSFATELINEVVPDLYRQGHRDSIRRFLRVADRLARHLTNAPLAEAQLRLAMGKTYDDVLFENREGLEQFKLVQHLAAGFGPDGARLARLADVRALASDLWERMDPQTALELRTRGDQAREDSPPDLEAASLAYTVLAEYTSYVGSPEAAERLAREGLRIAKAGSVDLQEWNALSELITYSGWRGATQELEALTDEYLQPFHLPRSGPGASKMRKFADYLHGAWIQEWTFLPEKPLRKALAALDPEADTPRGQLTRYLALAVARRGDWRGALAIMRDAERHSEGSAEFWNVEIQLAHLVGETELVRMLAVNGLARFSSGTDGPRARWLVEPLLLFAADPPLLPAISNLVVRSQQVPNWARPRGLVSLALWQYGNRMLEESSRTVQECLETPPISKATEASRVAPRYAPALAGPLFLRACIESKQGQRAQAMASYQEAHRYHATALQTPGVAYTGDDFSMALTAEILRRQAAALIGESALSP